jgi:hypothetical protein
MLSIPKRPVFRLGNLPKEATLKNCKVDTGVRSF